ncbi:MAG TPA: hypothetical protein VK889_00520, partial [Solirubrobacterales bacterium]|nr:hypothetical protein [Solirubrobacterales bacterium]
MAFGFLALVATAGAAPPWQNADQIRSELAAAQTELQFHDGAGEPVAMAAAALRGPLRQGLAAEAPGELAEVEAALASAGLAARQRDDTGLAAARGGAIAALRRGAMAVAIAAARSGKAARAQAWLQIRDFRKAPRITRPRVDGTEEVQERAAAETAS